LDVLKRLKEARAALKGEARALLEATEGRALSDDEQRRVNELTDELKHLDEQIEAEEAVEARQAEIEANRSPQVGAGRLGGFSGAWLRSLSPLTP
jgi:HK97 family phage major capsid protein